MNTEFYIARRLSERRADNRPGVMERVATIATAISLMVIIVTLSVVVGFKENLNKLLAGAAADVVVTAPQSGGVVSSVGLERSAELESLVHSVDAERVTTFTSKEGVLKSDDNIVGVLLKGIDTLYDMSFYADHLVSGALPRLGQEPRTKDILLSERVARRMDVRVGDRVEMLFVDDSEGVLRDRFAVSGVYSTGVDMIDNSYVITDIRNVARLYYGDNSVVTGYELWLKDGASCSLVADRLNGELMTLYYVDGIDAEAYTLESIFPRVYGWLATHDVNAVVVVVIMIVVALFNMVTSLLIIVLERQRMIGELRALGATRQMVIRVFVYRAMFIVARGVVSGAVLGIALCALQHHFALIPLPAEGYLLSSVPAAMCWGWWMVAIVGVVLTTAVVMLLPAAYSARISPAETMRYE